MFTENRSCADIYIRVGLPTLSCIGTLLNFADFFPNRDLSRIFSIQSIIKERSWEATMGGGVRSDLFCELVSLNRQVRTAHGHPLVQTKDNPN